MRLLTNFIFLVVFLLAIRMATILVRNLGAETVPSTLEPLAQRWTRAGRSPKWIRRVMWVLFVVLALAVVGVLGFGIYTAVLQLGMKWNS